MENKIVLGFPYAGAFLWLLNAEKQYEKSIKEKYDGSHPYYITLFGSNHNKILDETVSLALLFDEIYLAPVDAHFPKYEEFTDGRMYHNTELGIKMNWEWSIQFHQIDDQIDSLLKDPTISNILAKVPTGARRQIVMEAINQISISDAFDASIFAIPSYLNLCNRLNKLLKISEDLKLLNSSASSTAVSTVFNISSLQFSINSLDEFAYLRQQNDLKIYAESFRNQIQELPDGNLNELNLYEAMLKAMNTQSISDKIGGAIGITATLNGIASLFFPAIGLASGIGGLVLDASGRAANKVTDKKKWWLIAPEISKHLTKQRLEKLYVEKKGSH